MKNAYSNGLKKAVTFSYDDGVLQDRKLVEIFNKYGIKATFNLNCGLLDETDYWKNGEVIVQRLSSAEVCSLYQGHEIACHCFTHPHLPQLQSEEKQQEIMQGKTELEKLINKPVEGMAYPFGNYDDETISIMKNCDLKYGRVVPSSKNFDLPQNLYTWQATAHHNDKDIFKLIDDFLILNSDTPSLFYIWGHSYEFDVDSNWNHIEKICQKLSDKADIWYCTNLELANEIS